jgi:hypothetical protein
MSSLAPLPLSRPSKNFMRWNEDECLANFGRETRNSRRLCTRRAGRLDCRERPTIRSIAAFPISRIEQNFNVSACAVLN